ncbi:MAG: geranylgeranyl diphosphate reductase [Pseudomonadota bacterium]
MALSDLHYVDAVVVGGGPAGATAASTLAADGWSVLLLDKDGRAKPCGGAVPPRLVRDYNIPDELIVARAKSARMTSPSNVQVHMPIEGGYVGMVDRKEFDEWLRSRAVEDGAIRRRGTFIGLEQSSDGSPIVVFDPGTGEESIRVATSAVIGADGANSRVARAALPHEKKPPFVFAYHEIIESPAAASDDFSGERCEIYYHGQLSPDFYAWVFPHGETTSVGVGSAIKGFSLRQATAQTRQAAGLQGQSTVRCEGAPIPMRPMRRWDNGKDTLVVGDAAGVVAPASGEGIYYAMLSGELGAHAISEFLHTKDARALADARKRFMKLHGRVFWVLGLLQHFWYRSDRRRESFVKMCRDKDVQRLTWQAYMNKELVRHDPLAHLRVLSKDVAHLVGLASPR